MHLSMSQLCYSFSPEHVSRGISMW